MIAVAQVLATLLGIGALLTALLPHVDLSWVPVPDLDIGKPSWWPEFSLWGWVRDLLPDLEVPDWVRSVLKSATFWVPVLIAIGVASQEYERRKKQSKEKSGKKSEEEPADDET